jgi:hypothetical protein
VESQDIMLSRRKHQKRRKKKRLIEELKLNNVDERIVSNELTSTNNYIPGNRNIKTFYYTFYQEHHPRYNELRKLFDDSHIRMVNVFDSGYNIINTYDGYAETMEHNYPVFTLVKRKHSLEANVNGRADADCAEWLLDNYGNTKSRGIERTGFSKQYATAGAHSSKFRRGIHIKILNRSGSEMWEPYIQKWIGRCGTVARHYFPFGLLSSIKKAKLLVKDFINYNHSCIKKQHLNDTSNHNISNNKKLLNGKNNQNTANDNKKNIVEENPAIWASMATSSNYIAPSHTDNDAFLSCLFVTHCPTSERTNGKYIYPYHSDVCCFFCFPSYHTIVALRPGDILFFNPLVEHCVTQRTKHYIDEAIICSTFYLTTKQISGNDNSKPL